MRCWCSAMTRFYVKAYRDRIYAEGTNIDEMLHFARMHLETANHLKTFEYPIEDIAFEIHQSVKMGKKLIEVLREKRYNDPTIQGREK